VQIVGAADFVRGSAVRVVTILSTDIERSTRMWEGAPIEMAAALERHAVLVRAHRIGAVRLTAGCLVHVAKLTCVATPTVAAELVGHADALLARTGTAYEKAERT
jgi:hypothetical protein